MENLHVVLLRKNLTQHNPLEEPWSPCGASHWLALGHFDDFYIYNLQKESEFLSSIKNDKSQVFEHSDENTYYHPLYLVPYEEAQSEPNNKRKFIAILRIHFPKSLNLTQQFDNIYSLLSDKLKEQDLDYQIFYATEFSDMVLDIRSDRLDVLLNVILKFHEIKEINIGKMYTYFGVNYSFLLSEDSVEPNDTIPFFSMRFSGYNVDIIKQQIELIKNEFKKGNEKLPSEYCINGIDDIMLVYKNRSTSSLINLYRNLLLDDNYKKCRKSESTTKVGIKINLQTTDFQNPASDDELINSPICAKLPALCKEISELISTCNNKSYFGWFHAISEVANSLVRMSKTPIMDEVIFLIAPGVYAFLVNVIDLLKNETEEIFAHFGFLYDYVDCCSYFIEQLMRIEGQLSHNPEIRPVIYNIPIFMLEYTIAFLNKVSTLIKSKDDTSVELNTMILLVPRPCELVSAIEIFPAKDNIPGLVLIQIPENTLYCPDALFRALCHEISHYVGETFRNRKDRRNYYCKALAAIFTNHIFGSNNKNLLNMVKNEFLNSLNNCECPTINQMESLIIKRAQELIPENNGSNEFFRKYFNYCQEHNISPKHIDFLDDNELQYVFHFSFIKKIEEINILFREVFADICMLHILGLPSENYIDSLLEELYAHQSMNSTYAFAIRIYVTLYSMHIDFKYNGKYQQIWSEVYDIIQSIEKEIEEKLLGKNNYNIPIWSIIALRDYTSSCYNKISELLTNSCLVDIKKMYKQLASDTFQYRTLLNIIESYRKDILDSLNNEQVGYC